LTILKATPPPSPNTTTAPTDTETSTKFVYQSQETLIYIGFKLPSVGIFTSLAITMPVQLQSRLCCVAEIMHPLIKMKHPHLETFKAMFDSHARLSLSTSGLPIPVTSPSHTDPFAGYRYLGIVHDLLRESTPLLHPARNSSERTSLLCAQQLLGTSEVYILYIEESLEVRTL
jgi:hypothetical protein